MNRPIRGWDTLPDAIRAVIEQTIARASLGGVHADEVRADLCDHFRDGLEAGRTKGELLDAFGDPAVLGKLIGDSRRRMAGHGAGPGEERKGMTMRTMASLGGNLRYALRGLRRTPGFTIIAVLTLALGIGVNTAFFSVVRAALLSPLPLDDSEQLVRPYIFNLEQNVQRAPAAFVDFEKWRAETDLFEGVAHYQGFGVDLEGDPPVRIGGLRVSEDFFRIYRAEPVLGRLFLPEEFAEGGETVVVLTKSFWESRFGADPGVIGTTIRTGGRTATVVGVADETTTWPAFSQFWAPRVFTAAERVALQDPDNFGIQVVMRLQDGASLEQARTRVAEMAQRSAQDDPALRGGWQADAVLLREWVVGTNLPTTLWVLLGSATFVLLIACTNVASLLATRTMGRRRQIAIRVAMGARPSQVVSQLLVESLVLFTIGGALGVLVAIAGVDVLLSLSPAGTPRVAQAEVQIAELLFALGIAVVTGVGFGLYPALHARKDDPTRGLKEGAASSVSRGTNRFRQGLVVAEIALSMILLIGAGLMIRSLGALNTSDPGFRVDHLLTFSVSPPRDRYPQPSDRDRFYTQLTERLEALPGIRSAATTTYMPIGGGGIALGRAHLAEGMPEPPAGPDYQAMWAVVSPGLFATMEQPLLKGRPFTERDDSAGVQVAIINEVMAEQMFPGENPIGKRVRSWRDEDVYREIVGVVGNLRYFDADDQLRPLFFVPPKQVPWASFRNVVMRTDVEPGTLLQRMQETVSEVDPLMPVNPPRTGETIFDSSLAGSRFTTTLMGLFAALAMIVAALGVYGLISSSVANRTKELGIRTALGAQRGQAVALVMRQGVRLAVIGAVIGTLVSLALTGGMSRLLFQVGARDPVTFGGVAALLLAVAVVASWVPARKATKVDPVRALQGD